MVSIDIQEYKMKNFQIRTYLWVIMTMLLNLICYSVSAQSDPITIKDKKLKAKILHLDSLFWKTYNDCKTEVKWSVSG